MNTLDVMNVLNMLFVRSNPSRNLSVNKLMYVMLLPTYCHSYCLAMISLIRICCMLCVYVSAPRVVVCVRVADIIIIVMLIIKHL